MKLLATLLIFVPLFLVGCKAEDKPENLKVKTEGKSVMNKNTDTATFAAGCFWCTEAVFQRLKGVIEVSSGYTGGSVENPTYEQVCTGTTGHAEACNVVYDSTVVTYTELLEVFWGTHDPTTLNKQGADVGTQYRSAIFCHNEAQMKLAEEYKTKLDQSGVYTKPVVTQIVQFTKFYPAEDYHQDYYNAHKNQSYCSFVITPKLEKFRKIFHEKLKEEGK